MAGEQLSGIRRRLLTVLAAGIGGAVASAMSFAMAVYEAAHPPPLHVAKIGELIDTGRWVITVRGARKGPVPPTGVEPPEPKTFLTVEFDLENRAAASSYASTNLLSLEPPVPDLPDPTIYLARDRAIANPVHPGMSERLIATWEWPSAQPPPSELRLLVGSQIYKRRDNLYGASGWFDRDPVATVVLPVVESAAEATR
jgi:hypothetical protein